MRIQVTVVVVRSPQARLLPTQCLGPHFARIPLNLNAVSQVYLLWKMTGHDNEWAGTSE